MSQQFTPICLCDMIGADFHIRSAWFTAGRKGVTYVPPPFPHKQYLRFMSNKAGSYDGLRTQHRHTVLAPCLVNLLSPTPRPSHTSQPHPSELHHIPIHSLSSVSLIEFPRDLAIF
jgi:hypothetical protein